MTEKTGKSFLHSTQDQLSILDEFMEKHKELARGSYFKINNGKEKCNRLWLDLRNRLNAAGPPTRTIAEWKRVWTIRKYKAKQKLTQNKKALKKTGGGPYSVQTLTPSEESVINACGFEATVSGIVGVDSYGVNICEENTETIEDLPQSSYEEYLIPESNEEVTASNDFSIPTQATRSTSYRRETEKHQLLQKQVELNEKFTETLTKIMDNLVSFHEKFISILDENQKYLKSIKYDLKELKDLKRKEISLMEERNTYLSKQLEILQEEKSQKGVIKKEQFSLQRTQLEIMMTANELKKLKLGQT